VLEIAKETSPPESVCTIAQFLILAAGQWTISQAVASREINQSLSNIVAASTNAKDASLERNFVRKS